MIKLRNIYLNIAFSILLLLPVAHGYAAELLTPKISLVTIQVENTTETGGDELYLDIITYFSDKTSKQNRVPEYPLFWHAKAVDQIHNVLIWEAPLTDQQAATVVISIMEQDIPPWNTDDLIGFIKVHLKNDDGKLQSSFSASQQSEEPQTDNNASHFHFTGNNGDYELVLLVSP